MKTVKKEIKEGDVFYDEHNYKCYVVAILKTEKTPQVVFKYYGKHKQWWHYFVKTEWECNSWIETGLYTKKRKKR
jgi:hypothetical protein